MVLQKYCEKVDDKKLLDETPVIWLNYQLRSEMARIRKKRTTEEKNVSM